MCYKKSTLQTYIFIFLIDKETSWKFTDLFLSKIIVVVIIIIIIKGLQDKKDIPIYKI